jgi:predicted Zn-dependent peptidase
MHYTRKTLKNGLRVIKIPMSDNPTVTVLVLVEAGSNYETKKQNGLSHFLEHMCFKGTSKRPSAFAIARELDGIGAHYNAFTGPEYTGYYAKSDKRHAEIIFDVVTDVYTDPQFPEAEVAKEKGVVIDEISMYEDLPNEDVGDIFKELLYGDQPAGRKISGTKESVASFTRKDLIDYHKTHYVAPRTTLVVSGSFDDALIDRLIDERWSQLSGDSGPSKQKVVEAQDVPRIILKHKTTDQAHIVIGMYTCDMYSKDIPTLRVLKAVLASGFSSRLFQKIREEMGVGYYVHASQSSFTDHGYFSIATGVDPKRTAEVIRVILEELKRLTHELVSDDELKKAKDLIAGSMLLGLESSDDLAEFFGFQEIHHKPLRTADQFIEELRGVTSEAIKAVAGRFFKSEGLNLAIIGPFSKQDGSAFKKLLSL